MRRTVLTLAATTTLLLLLTLPSATAQETLFGIGPKAGLYLSGSGRPMVGAVAELPFSRNIYLEPGVELVLGLDNTLRLIIDANGRYAFRPRGQSFAPYLLGGLGLVTDVVTVNDVTETQTNPVLNLGGGIFLNTREATQYFGGIKIMIGEDDSDVLLQAGIVWYL